MADMYRVRVTLEGWRGAPGVATHYFEDDASPANTAAERALEVSVRVHDAWDLVTNMEPTIWTATVQNTVDVLDPQSGDLIGSHVVTPVGVLTGSEGSTFGPAASGLCVNWLTSDFLSGRRVRGRTFISPVNNGWDANGSPTEAHRTDAAAMYGVLESHGAGDPLFVVWHRPGASPTGSTHVVTGTSVRDSGSVLTSRR